MSIRLPYRSDSAVKVPAALRAYANGKIPGELLQQCGLRTFVMADPAAGAMRAMVAAAAGDGITLSATGTWRSYEDQKRLFLSRYVTRNTGGKTKVWNGKTYWQLPKVAMAATPGSSNHGFGLAADLSNSPTVGIGGPTLKWMADHGPDFGFWNTVKSEAWHWSYCLGDDLPSAVREMGGAPAKKSSVDWVVVAATDARLSAIPFPGEVRRGAEGDAVRAIQWKLVSFGHQVRVDGEFGSRTEAAVEAFQRAQGLHVDGRVGKRTWAALGLPGAGVPPAPQASESPPVTGATGPVAASVGAGAVTYEVRPGDGFVLIARRTLWSSSLDDAAAIAAANGLTLESSIVPGQILEIPSCCSTEVVAGDGWQAVATRLRLDMATVRQANAWQGDLLHPGMIIYGGRAPA